MNNKNLEIGERIVLLYMKDKFAPPIGTKGTIIGIDDIGQIHVNWDSGSSLKLDPTIDKFKKL